MRILAAALLVSCLTIIVRAEEPAPQPAPAPEVSVRKAAAYKPSIAKFNSAASTSALAPAGQSLTADGAGKSVWAFIKGTNIDSTPASSGMLLTADGNGKASWTVIPFSSLSGTVSNSQLANSSLTINAGSGLIGGDLVPLGGSITLSLGSNLTLGGTTTGTFSGNGAALTNIPASAVSGTIPASKIGSSPFFGNGVDGPQTYSSNASLTRDIYCTDLTINTGVSLNANGFRIFVTGTLTLNNGTISNNGVNTAAQGAGAGANAGTVGGGGLGGFGGSLGSGQAGTSVTNSIGASGGTGGTQTFPGGSGGTSSAPTASEGGLFVTSAAPNAITCRTLSGLMANGGAGGGGGGAQGGPFGGGGGGGGGVLMIAARVMTGTGNIQANGGTGGSGAGTAGGGGGGGGGHVMIVTTSALPGTITATANGGAAGAGTGTGSTAGTAGANGRVIVLY